MKKFATALYAALTVLAAPAFAAEGDTIWVQSHQQTHWNWAGNWYDTVNFETTDSYRRILMHYTLGCPSIGCSEWDYTTAIEISDPVNDSTTNWIELVRIITPYAGDKGANWTNEWIIDVTDYAPLFQGERVIKARYSGYQDGFTVTINFEFIEGTPPRPVLAINQLYHGTYRYGFTNDPIESHLVPVDIDVDDDMSSAMFRLVASGHSFGGNENCAEFCSKYYRLVVNGSQAVENEVWRDDCGSNPLEGQTGTWIYDRAGWCPGSEVTRNDDEIGNRLNAGAVNTLDVNWEGYTYTGGAGFDPQYGIEGLLFQYGDWNFANDIAVDDVLKPSLNDMVWDVNPVCNNPVVVLTNTGSEIVTKVRLKYWVEGAQEQLEYTYNGAIFPAKSIELTLPSSGWKLFGGKTANVFHVEVLSVNNTDDEYAANNHFASPFEEPMIMPASFVVAFTNNSAANETKYTITDDMGNVVASRTQIGVGEAVQDTVSLEPGCYSMQVTDSDCDGLSFFANSDGNGKIWLHPNDANNFFPPLYRFPTEFGCESELNFTVGYTIGVEEATDAQVAVSAFPNPASDHVLISVDHGFAPGQLSVYSQSGQLVFETALHSVNGVDVEMLAPGVYTAVYSAGTAVGYCRFVVIR